MGCCCFGLNVNEAEFIMIFESESMSESRLGEKQRYHECVEIALYSNCLIYDNNQCCYGLFKNCCPQQIRFSSIEVLETRSGDIIIKTFDGKRIVFGPNNDELNNLIKNMFYSNSIEVAPLKSDGDCL